MDSRPNRLILPATLDCPFPAQLRLNSGDLGPWDTLEILALSASSLPRLILEGLKMNKTTCDEAVLRLKEGGVPGAEVPRIAGTEHVPAFLSASGLLQALASLGFERLPILATRPAAAWLRITFGAEAAPVSWRLESE